MSKTRLAVRGIGRVLKTIPILLSLGITPALAKTGYYALDHAALGIKDPASTPLVAVTRVGDRIFAAGVHGVIIVSQDNGISWRQEAVPVDLTLTDIYFASPQDGFAVGHYGVILHTTNGGANWSRVLDGRDVIIALNATAAQAQAPPQSAADAAQKRRVAAAFQAAGPAKPLLAIGACGGGILAAGQQDMAMFSADGGASWNEWTSHITSPNFFNIYAILAQGPATYLIGESGLVLKSDGGCENFQAVPGPYTATLFGGLSVGPNAIMLYGLDGGGFLSTDAGKDWVSAPLPPDSVFDAGVRLASGRLLLGTLDGTLFLSDKYGVGFQKISATVGFQIADMVVANNGNVVIVGNGGAYVLPAQSVH